MYLNHEMYSRELIGPSRKSMRELLYSSPFLLFTHPSCFTKYSQYILLTEICSCLYKVYNENLFQLYKYKKYNKNTFSLYKVYNEDVFWLLFFFFCTSSYTMKIYLLLNFYKINCNCIYKLLYLQLII